MNDPKILSVEQDTSHEHIRVTKEQIAEFRASLVWLALNQAARCDMAEMEKVLLSGASTSDIRTHAAGVIVGMNAVFACAKRMFSNPIDQTPPEQYDLETTLRELLKGVL